MPTTLQDIGASGAGTSLANYAQRERALGIRQELGDARSSLIRERTELTRNQILNMRQQRAEQNKPIAWEVVENRFKVPAAAKYAKDLADALGYIGPDGNIKAKHTQELQKYLSMPMHSVNLSDMRLQYAKTQYETLMRSKKDPEFAKKQGITLKGDELDNAISAAESKYNAATWRNDAAINKIKITLATQEAQRKARVDAERLRQGRERIDISREKSATGKVTTWLLPNREIVRSYDDGRTYIGDNGRLQLMPTEGAAKVSAQMSGSDIESLKSQKEIKAELERQPTQKSAPKSIELQAETGTGPWAMVEAGIDAVAGGIGLDKLIGKEGFFNSTQEARQDLRLVKQLGKSALMNSSRGAIWEQKKIDKLFPNPDTFFTNPRTEARKFKAVRKAMMTEHKFNNIAIAKSSSPKEIERLKSANRDIERLMAHLETGAGVENQPISDDELIQKYLD